MTVAERVALGAALLDERRPGWWERTDVVRLNMSDACNCMLGQEFQRELTQQDRELELSPYAIGIIGLADITPGTWESVCFAREHGFEYEETSGEYKALRAEWIRVIEQRRGGS